MEVRFHPDVQDEFDALPATERQAMANAVEKLRAIGVRLGHPHTSDVRSCSLRELRPRAGRCPWRALYARVGDRLWILAIGPEAKQDANGFKRGVAVAEQRLEEVPDLPEGGAGRP